MQDGRPLTKKEIRKKEKEAKAAAKQAAKLAKKAKKSPGKKKKGGAEANEEIKEEFGFGGFNGDEPEDGPYLQILEAGKAREVAGLPPRPTRPEDVVLPKIMYVSMQSKGECTHISIIARKSIYPVMTCYNI